MRGNLGHELISARQRVSRGVGISEIQKTLGLSYAAIRDMIRLLDLPKPLDRRTQRFVASPRR